MREFLTILLRKLGQECDEAASESEAIQRIDEGGLDVVITDLRMDEETSGLRVLQHVKQVSPATQVIVMTAFASPETAIEALKRGAYDYLTKPFKVGQVRAVIERAVEKARLLSENLMLREQLESQLSYGDIVGRSSAMREMFEMVGRVAPTPTTVLIQGESGTGKELVARAIHDRSGREGEFVPVNCGAIPESLIEAELFGYVKGAFTGAATDSDGLFVTADGGTVLLDEVGELPLGTQVRLLRVLQEMMVKPVGGSRERPVDVRILAATNRDLRDEVAAGRFREDLFYRLNVITLELPPLRERGGDVALLLERFVDHFAKHVGRNIVGIRADALEALLDYDYPGNVRELQNIVERAVALETSDLITPAVLPRHILGGADSSTARSFRVTHEGVDLDAILGSVEKSLLTQALELTDGNRTAAAKLLGISFRSIRYRLEKFDMDTE